MIKKYKLTTNLSLKIVAFVFAAFLWLIVANVDNPVVRNTYANIPVTIVNEDVITQGGEVYSVLDEQNVNVVVYSRRRALRRLKPALTWRRRTLEPESGGRAAAGWAISSPAGSTRQTEKRSGRESSLGFRRLEAGGV